MLNYLEVQVRKQHERNPDPTKIFPIPNTCDLEKMFLTIGSPVSALKQRKVRPKNYLRQRGSSGNWDNHRVTKAEEVKFRNTMKYR